MNARLPHRARLLIIGDDLSGTADCAVTCANLGLNSMVLLGSDSTPASAAVDVLALDTDTRARPAAEAARLNQDAWRKHVGERKLYKKIDSTLRGNVATEVAALVSAGMAIVAPAFPKAGRTTRDGRQFIFGAPVEESEVWRNEKIAGRADLVAMLSQAGLKVALITLDGVRAGSDALRSQLAACRAEHYQAVVCDSETDADLAAIAQASAVLPEVFWVGSAGLATPLIQALDQDASSATGTTAPVDIPPPAAASLSGILAIVGSMSSISHHQALILQENAGDAIDKFEVDTLALLDPASPHGREIAARVTHTLQRERSALVVLSQAARAEVSDGVLLARQLAAHLGPIAHYAAGLIATGGETARAMLSNMGVESLRIVAEIDTGVPLMAADHRDRVLPVVTKAGGFGQPDTLFRAWQRLRAMGTADAQAPHNPAERKI